MLELEQAQQQILSAIEPLPSETISLDRAAGRILAEPLSARIDLPPFDNSAMDGYAVRATDVAGASASAPVMLRCIECVPAGALAAQELVPRNCVRVFTGSPLPNGADAVVMQEDTRVNPDQPDRVLFLDSAKPWENCRFRGEDVKRGTVLAESGDRLHAGRIALLAATGWKEVRVTARPTVALISTGSELREPGEPLAPGQIYESNRFTLATLVREAGAIAKIFPLIKDDLSATERAFESALGECDAVITSGGVSVGEFDVVKSAFQNFGGELAFWKIAIKPGKPFVFGQRAGKRWFGLPGNPVSAFVTFLLLVRPALLRMQGAKEVNLPTIRGTLAEPLSNRGDRRHFMRVKVDATGAVRSAGTQASHLLSSVADANGLVDVPPNCNWSAGMSVAVLQWRL